RRARHLARDTVAAHGAARHSRPAGTGRPCNELSRSDAAAIRPRASNPASALGTTRALTRRASPAAAKEGLMSHGQRVMVAAASTVVLSGLVLRAVTVHSVGNAPLIYRVTTNNNDLDGVEGLAAPGRLVELWYRQRNFREGIERAEPGQDAFSWCAWKNRGNAVLL